MVGSFMFARILYSNWHPIDRSNTLGALTDDYDSYADLDKTIPLFGHSFLHPPNIIKWQGICVSVHVSVDCC